MSRYVLQRLGQTVLLLLGVSFVTFALLQLAPGDVLSQFAENQSLSAGAVDALRRRFGLDQSWYVQYLLYLRNVVFRLDLGESLSRQQPVRVVLQEGVFNTLLLTGTAAAFTWAVAIPLGVLAAVRRHSWIDRTVAAVTFVWLSVPEAVSGLLLLLLAVRTGWFPVGGMRSLDYDALGPVARVADVLHHLVLPALAVGLMPLALRTRQMRTRMLDVLRLELVTTARAKGVAEADVVRRHALPNALNPMITMFGLSVGSLLSGSFVAEVIFAWPGLGRITLEALLTQDPYLVTGAVTMASVLLVAGNLAADLWIGLADPRVSYGEPR